jgi:hypothetical protein
MSIEIIKHEESQSYRLFIGGEEIQDSTLFYDPHTDQFTCEINNEKVAGNLIKFDPEDLLIFRRLKLKPLIIFKSKVKLDLEIGFKRKYKKDDLEDISFSIYLNPDIRYWNNSFTYEEYEELLRPELVNLNKFENVKFLDFSRFPSEYKQYFTGNSEIEFLVNANLKSENIFNSIDELLTNLELIDAQVYEKLLEQHPLESVTTIFNFPEEIKTSCEQYLLYFAQFLKDLGVNATANLKEETAGTVLFSVTPTNNAEALDKINEALAVYLNLPSSPVVYNDDFAAMRLKQQVDNLQHAQRMAETEVRSFQFALRLSHQTIEQQDKLIQQKDTIIEGQNKIIEKVTSQSIMMDSAENKVELEEVYEGLKIGESKFLKEQLGIHINPAKMIKTVVKNMFNKDENKSILGLDDKE